MFLYFCKLLLSASLLIVSDSANIHDMNQLAESSHFFWDPEFTSEAIDRMALKNKKILLVIHGYNNSFSHAIKTINHVKATISNMRNKEGSPLYDLVIGYIWPGYDNFIEYSLAVENAEALKLRMRQHLIDLATITPQLDVLAHSLGNRVILEALNFENNFSNTSIINHFFALAPAVDANAIQKDGFLFKSVMNCKHLFVMHSNKDDVLKLLYPLASGKQALGKSPPPYFKQLPPQVKFLDCSKVVEGHSHYFKTKSIFDFIEKLTNQSHFLNESNHYLLLLKDGNTKTLK